MDRVLEVRDLTKKFGNLTAVNGVSLSIKKGEVFGFLGPNGSGKSTTIRMLCGILTPTRGKGHVLGYDLLTEPENIRQAIGYMSQRFSLYQELTVVENLDFYAGVYSVPPREAARRRKELIEIVQLKGKERSLAGSLSGGWQQRLALACALLHRPRLLFLDEPTAGVDPMSRRNFWEILHRLAAEGVTIFVSTHYMDEAEQCHTLGFMLQGRLIGCDTPEELKKRAGRDTMEDVFITFAGQEGGGVR